MLTTLRRLVLCDWNCVVTFHQRSCLIPYPIDGKVSRHQFLPHHFPGLLRVWGWTTELLIVQSNYRFTNLVLAIQCVVLSLHTIFFFLKAPAKDWNKVKQSFFSNVIYTKGFEFGDNYSENVIRWYKPYSRKTLILLWSETLLQNRLFARKWSEAETNYSVRIESPVTWKRQK